MIVQLRDASEKDIQVHPGAMHRPWLAASGIPSAVKTGRSPDPLSALKRVQGDLRGFVLRRATMPPEERNSIVRDFYPPKCGGSAAEKTERRRRRKQVCFVAVRDRKRLRPIFQRVKGTGSCRFTSARNGGLLGRKLTYFGAFAAVFGEIPHIAV